MNIYFVIGPSGAGKSTFISEVLPYAKVIDLWDYQEHMLPYKEGQDIVDVALERYEQCKDALQLAIKTGCDSIVLEHTLQLKKRRQPYIDAVQELTDAPITALCFVPDEEFIKNAAGRVIAPDMFDMPSDEFDRCFIIKPVWSGEVKKINHAEHMREALRELVLSGLYEYGDDSMTWLKKVETNDPAGSGVKEIYEG